MHVAVVDPDRDGLQIYMVHEEGIHGPYGYTLRDGATGEVLFGGFAKEDVGRGMIGKVDPHVPGLQTWCSESHLAHEPSRDCAQPKVNSWMSWLRVLT